MHGEPGQSNTGILSIQYTMSLVRNYGLNTMHKLRQNWLDTIQLMVDIIGITINTDSMGPLSSVRHYVLCTQNLLS